MKMTSLDMQRAEHALATIEALRDKPNGKYISYVRGLPAAILQNGLGQALATLRASAKDRTDEPHRLLHDQVQAWLCRDNIDAPYRGKEHIIKAITAGDEQTYLHAHAEALAYLIWLKKFAVAFLQQGESA